MANIEAGTSFEKRIRRIEDVVSTIESIKLNRRMRVELGYRDMPMRVYEILQLAVCYASIGYNAVRANAQSEEHNDLFEVETALDAAPERLSKAWYYLGMFLGAAAHGFSS